MSKEKPKISFITPCYNDGKDVSRYVDSIKDQDFENWEMILVNDGSTDDSKEIIDSLEASDERITAIHLPKNQGACIARNKGAKKAKGEIYSFLPADSFLYPGMLRLWVEQLDEYPDYDFLYGGYRITDEDYNPVEGSEFFFHAFDTYLLEVKNYIDGSFPIRAKAFWEITKLMNESGKQKSEGLWDPAVKSLQDWDFWLSVVKDGGRKGIYIQDIFFETVMPHKGGLSYDSNEHWTERLEQIKKKHDIPERRVCVTSLGAAFHAKRVAYLLNADFQEMPSYKPHTYEAIYSIGFYPQFAPQQDQVFLNNLYDPSQGRTPAKKIIHFVGTDIWQLRKVSMDGLEIWKQYMSRVADEVLVEAEFTQKEIKKLLDIDAKIVPIPPIKLFDVMPLPEKFTVACYMPAVNREFYQPPLMEEVAKALPDVEFKFFGNPQETGRHKDIKNIESVGYINDMEAFIKECSAIIRFPLHDGLPISILEFLLAGRYAVTNNPIEQAYYVPSSDLKSIVESIKIIQKQKKPNQAGHDFWVKEASHDLYRERINALTGYDPKEYWENRAESWVQQAASMSVEEEDVKEFYDEVKPKSLIDLGCGDGRWVPIFEKWGLDLKNYMGIDIAGGLIDVAQKRFPDMKYGQFYMEKVEDYSDNKTYDLVFSYTTFEHIKEEDMEKAVKSVKKMGKKLLLVEPVDFTSRYYCRSHDYSKWFKVIKEKKLKDKTLYLCDLQSQ